MHEPPRYSQSVVTPETHGSSLPNEYYPLIFQTGSSRLLITNAPSTSCFPTASVPSPLKKETRPNLRHRAPPWNKAIRSKPNGIAGCVRSFRHHKPEPIDTPSPDYQEHLPNDTFMSMRRTVIYQNLLTGFMTQVPEPIFQFQLIDDGKDFFADFR